MKKSKKEKYYYTEEELKDMFGDNFKYFLEWMTGQTYFTMNCYLACDVDKFIKFKLPILDSNIKRDRSPLEITMLATQTNDTRIKISNSMPQDGQEYKK